MPRVTRHGPSRTITRTGTIGYDTSLPITDAPDPVDHADGAGVTIPVTTAGVVTIVNTKFVTGSVSNSFGSWGFTPTAGNLLIVGVTIRNGTSSAAPSGWTLLEDNAPAVSTAFDDGAALYGKVSDGTETSVTFAYATPAAGMHHVLVEVSGLGLAGYITNQSTVVGPAGSTVTTGSVTPTASAQVLIVGLVAGWSQANPYTPGAGWTELYDAALGGPEHPGTTLIYQIVASASGSYNPSTTAAASVGWRGVTAAFAEPGEAVYIAAPSVVDGSDTTFDYITEASVTAAGGTFLRATLSLDYILASAILRIGLEDAGSTTIRMDGATVADFSDAVTLATASFTATGGYTAQDVAFTLPATTGYFYIRFVLTTAAQGVRVYDLELYGPPEASTTIAAHLADTSDAHDASAVSVLDTGGYFTGTDVEAALAELAAAGALSGIWRPVMAYDGTNWFVVVDGDGTAVMAR